MNIVKTPKAPKAPKTVAFTKKKGKAGIGEVVFKRPPLTFEEHIKNLREGFGMANFKSLKYEIRTEPQQKEIEDAIMEKMGQWKYSPDGMASQIPGTLLEKVKTRWENAKQMAKDIFSQSLRQLMPNIKDTKINKALKENEEKMTLKFHTCLILIKNVESVVNTTTNTWKNLYDLHKPRT